MSFAYIISIHTFLAEGDGRPLYEYFNNDIISIHTFLAEGDVVCKRAWRETENFNPHLPCGRWRCVISVCNLWSYFNPHLPCGRWHVPLLSTHVALSISIHTFLAEGDWTQPLIIIGETYFNPHLPCGRWLGSGRLTDNPVLFQSTPSLRKVTFGLDSIGTHTLHFNPHLPCGRWLHSSHFFTPFI